MGHERIGFLPKTQQWNHIVSQLSLYDGDSDSIADIANSTLECIKRSYGLMSQDESVIKAIRFLAILSFSANKENQIEFLNQNGYKVDQTLSLFSILNSARTFIETENGSLETNKIAKDAILQTLSTYQQNNSHEQLSLFSTTNDIWRNVGTGAAFCELARSFFSAFTDRHLKYYLDRSAATSISDYRKYQSFSDVVASQSEAISHHAFETSKIMQSFAAGWYNNHVRETTPSDNEISGFLSVAFGKMKEEFRREADGE